MGKSETTPYNLIQLINSMPDELLNASLTGANEGWITQKVNAINHYRKLPQIDTKSKMWKKISAIEIDKPLILPGIPKITSFKDPSSLDAWAGFMEITEAKITTYLSGDLQTAGVFFQDIASVIATDKNSMKRTFKNLSENSIDRIGINR